MLDTLTGHKAILFSPRAAHRNTFLNIFLDRHDAYYYALRGTDATLDAFLRGLIRVLGEDNPSFGKQTAQALEGRKVKMGDLAEALVADLRTLRPRAALVILDDFDRLEVTQDVITFLERFVAGLGDDLKLVINSRTLSYEPWQALVHSGVAIVPGEEQALDGGILTKEAPSKHPHLEVYAFGQGHVFVNGREILEWDGPLPRNLFFYFLDHPLVTREEVLQTFWPGVGQREATNVFHVTKRKVSEHLGFEMSGYSSGFYKPTTQMTLHYDVAAFEREIASATASEDSDAWTRAIELYRGGYLLSSNMPWAQERREELRAQYTSALIGLARIQEAQQSSDLAIHFYLRALNEMPDREDVHRQLMTLFMERGQLDKARAQYQLLNGHLRREHGIAPSAATQALYDKIQA